MQFDPNAAATSDSGIFGLPFQEVQAKLVFLPVPWEATTSYGGGTSQGPSAIFNASHQVDLYDIDVVKPYEAGLFCLPESQEVREWNDLAKSLAAGVIEAGGQIEGNSSLQDALKKVNDLGERVNHWVFEQTRRILSLNKIPGIIGGDHSVPLGAIQAIAQKHKDFGVLHFDAHSDTRIAYEGFTWSHASIMYNVLEKIPEVKKLVQVGIRDFCQQEVEYCQKQGERVSIFFDRHLAQESFQGKSWAQICEKIVSKLPQEVWISFDIDGLDPRFCPHTGTPVPGGLDFHQANHLIGVMMQSGRKIIGFDLNEVAPGQDDEWDANVGARLLYKLAAWTLASQNLAKLTQRP